MGDTLTFYSDLINMCLLQINNSNTIFINKLEAMQLFEKCKKILHSIVAWLDKSSNNDQNNNNKDTFKELLDLFHLLFTKYQCSKQENDENLSILYNKQCLSLLSYSDLIRCDVLFNDIGHSYKKIKKSDIAFIYYNHFIDICDNIDDPNDEIDYSDFMNSNITIPHKNIPNTHIYNEKHREEIRDWVLEILATSEINPALSSNNNNDSEIIGKCIVTGTSLYRNDNIVKCRSCSQISDKSSWNLYVDYFKICPWCQQTQAPIY